MGKTSAQKDLERHWASKAKEMAKGPKNPKQPLSNDANSKGVSPATRSNNSTAGRPKGGGMRRGNS
jgi:hypothetical protein